MDSRTRHIKAAWAENVYYESAESEDWLAPFWNPYPIFLKRFRLLNLENVIEIGCGHGRHVRKYGARAGKITLVDVNESDIA